MFPGPKPVLPNAPVTMAASTVGATNAITSAERSRRRWRRSLRATKSATRTGSVPEGLAREVQEDRLEIGFDRSEEHTSELQSQSNLVCRLLLEKKKKNK